MKGGWADVALLLSVSAVFVVLSRYAEARSTIAILEHGFKRANVQDRLTGQRVDVDRVVPDEPQRRARARGQDASEFWGRVHVLRGQTLKTWRAVGGRGGPLGRSSTLLFGRVDSLPNEASQSSFQG